MDNVRDQNFASWMDAERAAFDAVHRLHQATQGGRVAPSAQAVAAVVALRRDANEHLALLSSRVPETSVIKALPVRRPAMSAALPESRRGVVLPFALQSA